MSADDPKPLERELADLLAAEKGAVFAPADAKSRVLSRLATSVGTPGRGGGNPGSAGSGARQSARLVSSLARPLSLAIGFAIGGASGAAVLHAIEEKPTPQVIYVDHPATIPSSAPVATATGVSSAIFVESLPSVSAAPVSSPSAPGGQLGAEQAILDTARAALGRGDGDQALAAAEKHEHRFPNGALAEEREAIAIQALVLVKRFDDAKTRGARFHQRFPGSVLTAAVDAALAQIP